MFSGLAKGYDRTNNTLSVGGAALWRVATVKAVKPTVGERVLDIAAGTGTSAAALAKTGAEVVAVDFSLGMIAEGKRRHPHLTFVEGDAEALPFPTDSFDAATISFGLRNVKTPQKALSEMHRVVRPGGRLVICEFSHPERAVVAGSYHTYLKYLMPAIARVTSSNPQAYTYLMESIREWPSQDVLAQWLRTAGFTRVAYRSLTGGIVALHRAKVPERNNRPSRQMRR